MNIAIVGLGVIGGSFAMGLQAAGYKNIYGIDINESTVRIAVEQGMIQKGFVEAGDILPEMDIIIISLYPNQIAPFVEQYRNVLKDGAILTDVTGVKTAIIEKVSKVLPSTVDFVFAHPMRGSEKKGIIGADHTRFIGANALITTIPTNKEASLKLIEKLYKEVGFDQVTRVSPEKHDEQIAYVSQLIHVLSVAVVNSTQASEETLMFAGNSFQELTRIADINADLWSELFLNNRTALLKSIEHFEIELDALKYTLEENDDKELKTIFSRAANKRREWY
ncbi:prephenate dehydrogenase [Carnobacterium inhibens]|uniref:Prephenate dehydrogenase n=2 Tax=Carnobacterium inhibens TaxID=147709 RepID=U5SBX3_9LACT|nr:prephenate dehydrogenase [Carnobacterium inhibens]AGY82556.1 prephenate dehydrogenase [Carnobacterium inhibens subsp. gilichinskyi]MBC9825426.1 prephenate dehydrogenase/arogenate dehydrogenase family protein [Carnobacterium inhibens]